jgi:hypothetical protein
MRWIRTRRSRHGAASRSHPRRPAAWLTLSWSCASTWITALGCLNCEEVCPAHVQYAELLIETRALLGPARHRPRQLIRSFTRPRWLRAARRMGNGTTLPRRKTWLSEHLPRTSRWRSALLLLPSTIPAVPAKPSRLLQAKAASLARFPGCVTSVEDATARQSAVTLLRAACFQVERLAAFCCGAMDLHGGELAAADAGGATSAGGMGQQRRDKTAFSNPRLPRHAATRPARRRGDQPAGAAGRTR